MNNLLPSRIKIHLKYDLKGSTYKRKVSMIFQLLKISYPQLFFLSSTHSNFISGIKRREAEEFTYIQRFRFYGASSGRIASRS